MSSPTDPHDLDAGGHEPVDVDTFIPTGICAICAAAEAPEAPETPENEGDN